MKNLNISEFERSALDKKQYVYKIIMNSTFGAFGNKYFRFFFPEIADSITYFARISKQYASNYFEKQFGLRRLYGDTDSVTGESTICINKKHLKIEDIIKNANCI